MASRSNEEEQTEETVAAGGTGGLRTRAIRDGAIRCCCSKTVFAGVAGSGLEDRTGGLAQHALPHPQWERAHCGWVVANPALAAGTPCAHTSKTPNKMAATRLTKVIYRYYELPHHCQGAHDSDRAS